MKNIEKKNEFDSYLTAANHLLQAAKLIAEFNQLYSNVLFNQSSLLLSMVESNSQNPDIREEISLEVDSILEELKLEIGELK